MRKKNPNKQTVEVTAVFNKPDNCGECPCSYLTEGCLHDFCQLVGYLTDIEEYISEGIPDWCPLIEVKTT